MHAYVDEREYPLKKAITDEQMNSIRLRRSKFHGEWNCEILTNVQ